MPPQRRKIVPPTTTSKARKKIAGSNRKAAPEGVTPDSATPDTAATPDTVATPDTAATPDTVASSDAAAPGEPTTADVADSTTPEAPRATESDKVDLGKPAPAVAADAPEAAPVSTPVPADRPKWTPVIAVGAVAVVLGAFAVVAAIKPGVNVDNAAWVDSNATSEVTGAATDALTTLYTYSDATIDEDFDKARAVLNPDMLAEFDRVADTTKSAVRQTQTATQADVSDIGVTRLESDNAELLAVLNVSATQAGVAQGNAEGPIVVNMEKIDGKWILSAISDQ
ncbi:Mce-associated membrane protein [Rhodococcoides kyotonense]|uniref:Mce-associated membrane protein n=1 Tax=Rhodococcoides kyotonense TaxID=398843 RepID=A0A239MM06_9NOCA|nr:Mce-associated membrane protein [Rhodococcus kyotonensis]